MAYNRFELVITEVTELRKQVTDEVAQDCYDVVINILKAYELHEPEEIRILRLLIKIQNNDIGQLREEVAQERKARKQAEIEKDLLYKQLYHIQAPKAIGN